MINTVPDNQQPSSSSHASEEIHRLSQVSDFQVEDALGLIDANDTP